VLAFLLGAAIIAAVFAGIYYAPGNDEARVNGWPAFNLAPGEVRQDGIQPSVPDSPIAVQIEVITGEVDIYVMDKEWAASLPQQGSLRLDAPFSYYQDLSASRVNTSHTFTIISDGETWFSVVFDNSDNYYDDDAVPAEDAVAELRVTVRYLEQEDRSLLLGYVAVVPSILLVVVTLGRVARRHLRARKESG